jgi:hypothetical protein
LTAPDRFANIARMPRSPLLLAAALLSGCHEGVPFSLPDACNACLADGGPDAPADDAPGQGAPPSPDGPDAAPGPDVPTPAAGGDAGTDASDGAAGDGASPPRAACPAAPVPESCQSGAARCGSTECVSLNTDQHCGRCGRTCGDSFCQAFDCRPVQVAAAATGALKVALNERAVFWATGGGEIFRRSLSDGTVTPLAANEGRMMALLADDRSLYVVAKDGLKCPQNACLWRMGADAAGPGPRESLAELGVYTGGMAMDADALYWFDSGNIVRLEKAGLARRDLATGEGSDMGLAVDDQYVYWASDAGGEGLIKRAAKDGKTPPRPVARGLMRPQGVAVDDLYVYWTDVISRLVQRAPKEGGTPVTLASHADPLQVPVTIAVSADDVYWSLTGGNRGLRKVPRCGGDTRIIEAAGVPSIIPWKGDVFWADDERGVFRIAR